MSGVRGSRWRAVLAAVLIVVAGLLTPISVAGAWVRAQLVEPEQFVDTFAPLADDPAVQALVIAEVTDQIDQQLGVDALVDSVFDGIAQLGLPAPALRALDLLRVPAVQGAQGLIDRTVTQLVESEAFAQVWRTALRASHRALEASVSGGGDVVTIDREGVVGIELGPIVADVRQRLIDGGMTLAAAIPDVERTIVLVQSDALVTVQAAYVAAVTVGWWLPLLVLALFVAGILVARRRSTALLGAGVALAGGAGALALTFAVADAAMGIIAVQSGVPRAALEAVYTQVVAGMRQTAAVLTVIGIVVAVLAWVQGRWGPAAAVRRGAGATVTVARDALRSRGADPGRFGRWMDTNRVLVRVVIAALGVLWLWLARPLGVGEVILVVVVALSAWWIAEVLRTPAPVSEEPQGAPSLGL